MNPFTDPLPELLLSQAVYVQDHFQRLIGSSITQEFAGSEPGNRTEENLAGSDKQVDRFPTPGGPHFGAAFAACRSRDERGETARCHGGGPVALVEERFEDEPD